MNHPLLEKLETYYIRFKEIGQLITDPEVIQDHGALCEVDQGV